MISEFCLQVKGYILIHKVKGHILIHKMDIHYWHLGWENAGIPQQNSPYSSRKRFLSPKCSMKIKFAHSKNKSIASGCQSLAAVLSKKGDNCVKSLPNNKILDWSKLKTFEDDKIKVLNPFPHNDTFWRPWKTSLLKTLWEKEKLLATIKFLLYPQCFLPV